MEIPLLSAYGRYWKKAFDFKGRTSRAEFWSALLVGMVVGMGLFYGTYGGFDQYYNELLEIAETGGSISTPVFLTIFSWVNCIPGLSIYVRRLRDVGKSWPWFFILLIPFIGAIWFLVLLLKPSKSVAVN